MAELYDEIRGEFRADQARMLAKRYGWMVALLVLVVLLGIGGWQYRRWTQGRADAAAAGELLQQMQLADAPGGPHAGVPPGLQAIAGGAPDIYRVLALLREASIRAEMGDVKAAVGRWDQVAADGAAPRLLRGLATLLSVQHQVGQGEANLLIARLGGIEAEADPWRPLAEETQALIELRAGRQPQASELLRQLQADARAPEGVRGRARALLQALGAEPAAGLADDAVGQGN